MTIDYFNGYYCATDEVIFWINALDTEDCSVKELRSQIVEKLMTMRPVAHGRERVTRKEGTRLRSIRP